MVDGKRAREVRIKIGGEERCGWKCALLAFVPWPIGVQETAYDATKIMSFRCSEMELEEGTHVFWAWHFLHCLAPNRSCSGMGRD